MNMWNLPIRDGSSNPYVGTVGEAGCEILRSSVLDPRANVASSAGLAFFGNPLRDRCTHVPDRLDGRRTRRDDRSEALHEGS